MKKLFALLAIATTAFSNLALAADKYEIDKSHTRILFYVNHLGFSDMVGEFTDYDGHFNFDPKKPDDSSVEINLKPSGIRTSSEILDGKLQGADFFKSDQFPAIKFTSEKIKITSKNTGKISGTVSMLGIDKPATMNVKFNKADYNPYSKNFTAGFSATAKLKRSDFGMISYLPAVGDEVRIEVQIEGINVTRKEQEAVKHK